MYDIRQFKPTLYAVVLMGLIGYAMAALSPGFFFVPVLLVLLNGWLVMTKRFLPFPRWLSNVTMLLSLTWALLEVYGSREPAILVVGQFLVFLQLVKLYEQRANRDYAQLLILSLLLMVSASISTASLLFGLLMIVYLFVSLYCCLLFHLKVETEHARSAMALPDRSRSELTLRQDQRNLSRSMRRLAGLISSAAIITAVVVFLFFPRGLGMGLLGPLQIRPPETLTGFSDQVSFQHIAQITQSNEVVGYIKVYKNDVPLQGVQTLLLRGLTLNVYSGNSEEGPWQWSRSQTVSDEDPSQSAAPGSVWKSLLPSPAGQDVWRQDVQITRPTGTPVLFSLAGPYALTSSNEINIGEFRADESLQSAEAVNRSIAYSVWSRGYLIKQVPATQSTTQTAAPPAVFADSMKSPWGRFSRGDRRGGWGMRRRHRPPTSSIIDPKIAEYARRPEVSGGLAAQRDHAVNVSPLDGDIAAAIEHHLQTDFTYTLKLTDSKDMNGQDPMVWFLSSEGHRGHCEYFAGAMTLMCQSLGMNARMVVGFKCDEYNEMMHQYIIRQSNAHAWVEVETDKGWRTFDPTSGRETPPPGAMASMWGKARHLMEFLEFTWAKNVVAYDNDNRENLVATLNRKLTNSAEHGNSIVQSAWNWIYDSGAALVSSTLLSAFMALMIFTLVAAVAIFMLEKFRLRRRAQRIGLDALPPWDQLKLARQLGFYDDLMQLLDKHQIRRPEYLTPMEFSKSLAYLPAEAFQIICRLTSIFYQIRYGRRELSAAQLKRLNTVISRLPTILPTAKMT